jgi:hypothetical protein
MVKVNLEDLTRKVPFREIVTRLLDMNCDMLVETVMSLNPDMDRLKVTQGIWETLDKYLSGMDNMDALEDLDAEPTKWVGSREGDFHDTMARSVMEAVALIGVTMCKWVESTYKIEENIPPVLKELMAEAMMKFFFLPLGEGVQAPVVMEMLKDKFDFRTEGTCTWMEAHGLPISERYKYVPNLTEEERENYRTMQERIDAGLSPEEAMKDTGFTPTEDIGEVVKDFSGKKTIH